MKVRIEPTGPSTLSSPGAKVLLDGQDCSRGIQSYELAQVAGRLPELVLHLSMPEVVIDGEITVLLTDETRELLQSLGWAPPEGNEEAQA